MVIVTSNGKEFYMDGIMKENMDLLKEIVDKNWDGLGYIFGYEGDGKTRLGTQLCFYLDSTFNLDRVVFTPEQFMEACNKAEKKQAILFDEAYFTFNNKALFDDATKSVISMLTMIRKKQLYILIIAPTIFDMQKYLILHRSRFCIRVYANGLQRGFFMFWNRERKYNLYIKGKKEHNLNVEKANFIGRFTDFSPLDEQLYEKKKDAAIEYLQHRTIKKTTTEQDIEKIAKLKVEGQNEIIAWLRSKNLLKLGAMTEISNFYNISQRTFRAKMARINTEEVENEQKEFKKASLPMPLIEKVV